VFKNVGGALAAVAALAVVAAPAVVAALLAASAPAVGEDDFPIVGTYAKDQICKGDGSDPADMLVKITGKGIESTMGFCAILNKKRTGRTHLLHVECKAPGNQIILGDVTFIQRDDDALDFDDQDHTSPAVLYKCGK